eukprot:988512-Alexandrium_andersonii.AAC.1
MASSASTLVAFLGAGAASAESLSGDLREGCSKTVTAGMVWRVAGRGGETATESAEADSVGRSSE